MTKLNDQYKHDCINGARVNIARVNCLICQRSEVHELKALARQTLYALQELVDWQNGCPLATYAKGWNHAMQLSRDALKRGEEILGSEKRGTNEY